MAMDRAAPVISSFAGGEVSPFLGGRQDLKSYYVSLALCENFICLPQGPLDRRGGTRYVAPAKSAAFESWLIDFEFNDEQAYVLEFADQALRFFMNRRQISVPATTAAPIVNGDFPADLSGWAAASVAQSGGLAVFAAGGLLEQTLTVEAGVLHVLACRVDGLVGRDSLVVRIGTAAHGSQVLADRTLTPGWHLLAFTPSAATVYLEFAQSAGTPKLDGVRLLDDEPLELPTPYLAGEIRSLGYDQSADVLYLCHGDHPPAKLERRGHTTWSLVLVDLLDGPYLPENAAATTLTPAAASGSGITITASAVAGINDGKGFLAADLGRAIRIKHSTTWGWARISEVTDSTHVKVEIRTAFGGTGAVKEWRLGLYSDNTGWPAAPTFYEERLVLAGARIRPARLDGSASGDFETFAPGTNDADPFSYNTGTRRVYWLASTTALIGGALGGAFVGRTDAVGAPITPTNFQVKANGAASAAALRPLVLDEVIYAHRHRRKLFAYGYSLDKDRFIPRDITLLAEHITRPGLGQLAYQEQPFGLIWAVRDDGILLGCTYLPDQEVTAWHRHRLGASSAAPARVRSVCVIPGSNRDGDGSDEVWLVVERVIDGAVRRYIEILEDPLPADGLQQDAFYVDCGLSLYNAPAAALTPGAATGAGITFTADAAVFSAGHVGRELHADWTDFGLNDDGIPFERPRQGRAVIAAFVDPETVTADIIADFPGTDPLAEGDWRLTAATISGLDHLEGETVQILADGGAAPSRVVAGGSITLDTPASVVHVGLAAPARAKLLPIEAGRFAGSSSKLQRITSITARFLRSLGGQIGRDEKNLFPIESRMAADPMNAAPPLVTGIKKLPFDGEWQYSAPLMVVQTDPQAMTLLSLTPEIASS